VIFFRQEHNIGLVEALEFNMALVEGIEEGIDGWSGRGPSGFVERKAQNHLVQGWMKPAY